jgi:hypothetical protein
MFSVTMPSSSLTAACKAVVMASSCSGENEFACSKRQRRKLLAGAPPSMSVTRGPTTTRVNHVNADAMPDSTMDGDLSVELWDGEIVVNRTGTAFFARYHKPDGDPPSGHVRAGADRGTIFQFRAQAFAAAMNKARELGWIA